MISINGYLNIDYKGKSRNIEYNLKPSGYGGLPFITINDNKGYSHSFARTTNFGWRSITNSEPKWPEDFIKLLYEAFEKVYREIGEF